MTYKDYIIEMQEKGKLDVEDQINDEGYDEQEDIDEDGIYAEVEGFNEVFPEDLQSWKQSFN